MPGMVQGGARVRRRLLQLRRQQCRSGTEAGDRLPIAERDPGQQPVCQSGQSTQPVLHGQDEHQIR